jgi:cytochrome o ubiquinol oxidase subunit 2
MIVLFLGGVAWVGSHELDPHHRLDSTETPLKIEVVSMDWKWLFIYPEQGVASVNQVMLPVGRPVEFDITSLDVMNDFFIPRLGSQIYSMAGMVTTLNLQADEAGTFPGLSAHFSGDGFSDMRFTAIAVSPAQFAQWVNETAATAPALDDRAYAALVEPSQANPVAIYKNPPPDLFNRIVAAFDGSKKTTPLPHTEP